MRPCYPINSSFEADFFEFCLKCYEKERYFYDIIFFHRDQNRDVFLLTSIANQRKEKILDMKRVNFHPSVVTGYIESAWQNREELDAYHEELNLQYPDISTEERSERRNENYRKAIQRALNNESYDKFFMDYPSGLCYLPSYVDCDCDLGLEVYAIRKKISLELSTAPPVFSHIHPFDENLTFYFNSYLNRSMDVRPINSKKIKHGKIKSLPSTKRNVFYMPFELERRLWVYRIVQFRDWKLSHSKNNTDLPPDDNDVGICKYSYFYDQKAYPSRCIEDPMKYFKY